MSDNHKYGDFFNRDYFAIYGLSQKSGKFGTAAYRELKKRDYHVVGISPTLRKFDGDPCYRALKDFPEKIDAAFICVQPQHLPAIVDELIEGKVRSVWFQQGLNDAQSLEKLRDNGIETISGECILMYAEPVRSFHAFHRWLKHLFH